MFQKGDLVNYKKYLGEVIFEPTGRTCEVKLYNYRGLKMVCKTIPQNELILSEQIRISGF